jgi:glutamyl-tRNA synthetase
MPFSEAAPRLQTLGLGDADEAFWDAVRANLSAVPEARGWWRIVEGPLAPHIEEPELTNAAADLLPNHPWSRDTWPVWTVRIAEATGRTGRGDGPAMQDLLPLVGPDRAAARLRGRTA